MPTDLVLECTIQTTQELKILALSIKLAQVLALVWETPKKENSDQVPEHTLRRTILWSPEHPNTGLDQAQEMSLVDYQFLDQEHIKPRISLVRKVKERPCQDFVYGLLMKKNSLSSPVLEHTQIQRFKQWKKNLAGKWVVKHEMISTLRIGSCSRLHLVNIILWLLKQNKNQTSGDLEVKKDLVSHQSILNKTLVLKDIYSLQRWLKVLRSPCMQDMIVLKISRRGKTIGQVLELMTHRIFQTQTWEKDHRFPWEKKPVTITLTKKNKRVSQEPELTIQQWNSRRLHHLLVSERHSVLLWVTKKTKLPLPDTTSYQLALRILRNTLEQRDMKISITSEKTLYPSPTLGQLDWGAIRPSYS